MHRRPSHHHFSLFVSVLSLFLPLSLSLSLVLPHWHVSGSMTGDQPGARRDAPPRSIGSSRCAWMHGPRHFDGFSWRDLLRRHPPRLSAF